MQGGGQKFGKKNKVQYFLVLNDSLFSALSKFITITIMAYIYIMKWCDTYQSSIYQYVFAIFFCIVAEVFITYQMIPHIQG